MQKERLRPTGINVDGNYKNKGFRFGKRLKVATGKTKKWIAKKQIKHGAQFQKYGGPSVRLARGLGVGALGVGKFALKRGGLGFPGLAATGLYFGAKHAIKKGERVYKRTPFKQFDKKGRWML